MDIGLVLVLLLMGAVGGFLAGLLGIGGGMILVPFITMIFSAKGFADSVNIHMAVATSLGVILFTSMSSVRAHHLHGAVLWRVALLLSPGILLGAWCGPWIAKQMSPAGQAILFCVFLGFSATQILFGKKAVVVEGVEQRGLPGSAAMFGAGGVIGLVAGLLGAGGGFLSIPFMTWCNVRMQNAVATSAALGFPIALAGTLSNIYYGWGTPDLPEYSLGFIYLPALLVIAAASVTLAPLGARTAHKLPVQTLKKIFAVDRVGPHQHRQRANDHRQRQHLAGSDRHAEEGGFPVRCAEVFGEESRAAVQQRVRRADRQAWTLLARVQPQDDEYHQAVDQQLIERRWMA